MNPLVKRINKWRSQYNPLRGLTLQRAVSLLEAGERGEYADLQWTYRFVEKRDATLRALLMRRISAIKALDWDIKTVDDSAPAQAQAKILRGAYEQIGNLKAALAFLAVAEFRGFAHLEKRYLGDKPSGPIIALEPVPQWHWVRPDPFGPWLYNAEAASTNRGEEIDSEHFLVREVERPINEIGLICFLRKNLSQKDWDGFVETYGIPPLFVEMPPNTPQGKEAEYQAMADAVVGDLRGTLPNGSKIHTADAGARGTNPFRDHLNYQDEQLVLAGTSGKLTMLNGPTGLGSGQSDAHADTFGELAEAEAAEISELLQCQIDRTVLGLAEGEKALAYFQLAAKEQEDVSRVLDDAVKATQAGLVVDAAQLSEKTGYTLTTKPAPVAPSFMPQAQPAFTANRSAGARPAELAVLKSAARAQIASALARQLEPVRAKLQAALDANDDAAMQAELAALKADLPRQARAVGADSDLVKAWEEALGTALVQGALDGAEATATTVNRALSVLPALPERQPIVVQLQSAPAAAPAEPVKVEITLNQPNQPSRRVVPIRDDAGKVTEYRTEEIPTAEKS